MNLTPSQVKAQGSVYGLQITGTPKAGIDVKNQGPMTVRPEELKKVRHLIYWCPKCKVYHLFEGNDFEDVEAIIGK